MGRITASETAGCCCRLFSVQAACQIAAHGCASACKWMSLCFTGYRYKVFLAYVEDKLYGLFQPSFPPVISCVCVCAPGVCVHALDLPKGRKRNWGAGFNCGTLIVDPCIAPAQQSRLLYTHTHLPHWPTRLTYEWQGQFLSLTLAC